VLADKIYKLSESSISERWYINETIKVSGNKGLFITNITNLVQQLISYYFSVYDNLNIYSPSILLNQHQLHFDLCIEPELYTSRWEERLEGEGGHEDCEGQWVDEKVES
jgi:hypothetical protein